MRIVKCLLLLTTLGACDWPGNGGGYPGIKDGDSMNAPAPVNNNCGLPQTPARIFACRVNPSDANPYAEVYAWDDPATEAVEPRYELRIPSDTDPGETKAVAVSQDLTQTNLINYRGEEWRLEIDVPAAGLSSDESLASRLIFSLEQVDDPPIMLGCVWQNICSQ